MSGTPPTDEATLREALLDQLAYLIDEIEVQKPLLMRLPSWALEDRPFEGTWSIVERYGLLAATDEAVFEPQARDIAAGKKPLLESPNEDLTPGSSQADAGLPDLLSRIQTFRARLVEFLRTLPPDSWSRIGYFGDMQRDLYAHVHAIIQHDADCLRLIGERLFESNLSSRGPKSPEQSGL